MLFACFVLPYVEIPLILMFFLQFPESILVTRNLATASATAHLHPFKLYKLDDGPASTTTCTREEALHFYETMQRIRRMETTLSTLYKEKKVRGFCHLYSGQVSGIYNLNPVICFGS